MVKSSHSSRKSRATPYVKPRYQDGVCVALAILAKKRPSDYFSRDDIIDEWALLMQDAGKPVHPRGKGYVKTVLRDLIHHQFIEKAGRGSDLYRVKKNLRVLIEDERTNARLDLDTSSSSSEADNRDALIERFRYYFKNIGVLKKPTFAELYEETANLRSELSQLKRERGIMSDDDGSDNEVEQDHSFDIEMPDLHSGAREFRGTPIDLPPPPASDDDDDVVMEADQQPEAGPSNPLPTKTPTRPPFIPPEDNYPTPQSIPHVRESTPEMRRRPMPQLAATPRSPTPFRPGRFMRLDEKAQGIENSLRTHNAELELANAKLTQLSVRLQCQLEESETLHQQEIERRDQEIEELERIVEEQSAEIEYLYNQQNELEAIIESQNEKLKSLTEQLHLLEYNLDDLDCENEASLHALEEHKEQLQVEKMMLQESLKENRLLREERDTQIREREQKQKEYDEILDKYTVLEGNYHTAVKERDDARAQCGKYRARVVKLEQHAQMAKALLESSLAKSSEDEGEDLHLGGMLDHA